MQFSDRYFMDELFQMYCQTEGLEYCIMNFISWIDRQTIYKAQLIQHLTKE